jgi:N-acetyl-1-D-myo-inositol-2-amino-2-deoxy-alpha-D-glucopyranoside deacetylase
MVRVTTVPPRLLLVHAHPDDESINNGATMAKYIAEGMQVTLVTCTRGELGEVIPERLAHLVAPAGPVPGDALGDHRVGELAAAMAELGVTDHRFLGDLAVPGRRAAEALAAGSTVYRDSGMAYADDGRVVPALDPPVGAFALVDPDEPARALAALIRELRPQVVVTYEPGGGYGHPDHVQAHRVTMRAVSLAGDPAPTVYWVVKPESLMRATLSALAQAEGTNYHGLDPAGRMPSEVVADDEVTAEIDAIAWTRAKVAALTAHETQVTVSADGAFYALSNHVRHPVLGLEFYRRSNAPTLAARQTSLF